jgi:hypothetical protein
MRHLVTGCLLLVSLTSAACAGPHSTGALWAQQNLDQERAMYQLSDAQRAGIAQAFELSLADESLQAERQRITTELQNCPGPRQRLGVSPGDVVRDTVRVRSQSDPGRLMEVAQLALADWYTRRAAASGNAQFCEQAQAALNGKLTQGAAGDLLDNLPVASVTRDPGDPSPVATADPPLVRLSQYALGSVDGVTAAAPLPQYLAVAYGGLVTSPQVYDEETAADRVDKQAAAYPDWEPDALYAALRGAQL